MWDASHSWLPKFSNAVSVLYSVICTLTLPKVAAIRSSLVLVMLQNQTKLTFSSEEDFQQTLHLEQSWEVAHEWHAKGEAKVRGSLFLHPSQLCRSFARFLAAGELVRRLETLQWLSEWPQLSGHFPDNYINFWFGRVGFCGRGKP